MSIDALTCARCGATVDPAKIAGVTGVPAFFLNMFSSQLVRIAQQKFPAIRFFCESCSMATSNSDPRDTAEFLWVRAANALLWVQRGSGTPEAWERVKVERYKVTRSSTIAQLHELYRYTREQGCFSEFYDGEKLDEPAEFYE